MTEEIAPERLVAIVRTRGPELAVPLAEAIVSGGISSIEVALTTPRALEAIAELVSRLADRALVGAGTVRNASDAESAIAAGARFLVSPDFNEKVARQGSVVSHSLYPGSADAERGRSDPGGGGGADQDLSRSPPGPGISS